ncbi:DegT/DnrJ/EryC1/StrS aminotransferase family protein [bacterium]|nr:DegT/DnrJ/EryC1/StrS aminotransferase family protein [candidate division CSSED10-310 bacterium]
MIPHSKPSIGEREVDAVIRTVRSGVLSNGIETSSFENDLRDRLERDVACLSSGTAALHLGLLAAGVKSGSRVAIPTHSCPSVLYALHYIGAVPVLFDSGAMGIGSDPVSMEKAAERSEAVVIVHQYGVPDSAAVSRDWAIPVIEDCATAIGAMVSGKPVGTFGTVSVFSFYATKMMAAGECGAVASDSDKIQWIRHHRTPRGADDVDTRFPYGPSDLSAALARIQLARLEDFIAARTKSAERYTEHLQGVCRLPVIPERSRSVWHRYIVETDRSREAIIQAAAREGIQIGFGVRTPIHRLLNIKGAEFPNSDYAYRFSISLPIYPDLTLEDQDRIISFIRDFI